MHGLRIDLYFCIPPHQLTSPADDKWCHGSASMDSKTYTPYYRHKETKNNWLIRIWRYTKTVRLLKYPMFITINLKKACQVRITITMMLAYSVGRWDMLSEAFETFDFFLLRNFDGAQWRHGEYCQWDCFIIFQPVGMFWRKSLAVALRGSLQPGR